MKDFYGKPIILETELDQEFLSFMLECQPFELVHQGPNLRYVWQPPGMGDIAKTLLTYTADVTVRGHPIGGSLEAGSLGPTVTDLASDDGALHILLRAHQMSHTARELEEIE